MGFGNKFETIRLSVMSNIVTIYIFYNSFNQGCVHLDNFHEPNDEDEEELGSTD